MTILTEKAMLASLNISAWNATKHDPTVSDKVARDHNADRDMGRYTKRLIAKERLDAIREAATKARHHHYDHTLPWLDTGARILPAASYFDYMRDQNAFAAQFDAAVADFVSVYPVVLDEAKRKLGKLFNPADYPSHAAIRERFVMRVAINQMPEPDDFRVQLGAEEEQRIRDDINARLGQAASGCVNEVWTRIHDHVAKMVERLGAYKVTKDGVQGAFRDSLVENIRELCDIMPALNVTNNNALEDMRQTLMQELCAIDAPVLRDDTKVRKAVAKKAAAILKDVSDFMA